MKAKLFLATVLSFSVCLLSSQVPQGFNYQAIARDGSGTILANQLLPVTITIQSEENGGTVFWVETHSTITTNSYGLFSLILGTGTRLSGLAYFSDIDWTTGSKYIKTQIFYEDALKDMGTSKLWSVPYSMVAKDIEGPVEKFGVTGTTDDMEEALFEVKNKTGQTVFAVYNEGVRIYVDDGDKKGVKGGFAIGGFGLSKGDLPSQNYLFVSADSIRAYIGPKLDGEKASKGGFAIGGFGLSKAPTEEYLRVTRDSTRVYVNESGKASKGGFSIGGFGMSKGTIQNLFDVSADSIRMYINDAAKASKGGFAIGGFGLSKDGDKNYLNVATDATGIINPSQNKVLWYPIKNAFLVGKVLIEKPDSVGENSFAAGFESKPKGDYSQALGYKARTEGTGSTAIGSYAFAKGNNSFALGDSAFVSADDGYAIGAGTLVTGRGSFALGSKDKLFGDNYTLSTSATGELSMALGLNADAVGKESFAAGISVTAEGDYSVALGRSGTASGMNSLSIQGNAAGMGSTAIGGSATGAFSLSFGSGTSSGWGSVVIGNGTASNESAIALGYNANTTGAFAIAAGSNATAQSYGSFVIGSYNRISGTQNTPITTDPLFVIGNGTYITPSNAFTVLRNGRTAIGHDAPTQMLDVNGQVRIRGGSPAAGKILTSAIDGTATWEYIGTHSHAAADITSGALTVSRGGTGLSTLTANKILVGNGTTSVLQPANLHWDNLNSRLGIADATPSYSIDVAGSLRTTLSAYMATSSGGVGIGTTAAGSYKLSVLSSIGGLTGAAGNFENTNTTNGIALKATTNSSDGTALFIQEGAGYSLRCDGYDPTYFVAFVVRGRNVGIGNSSPGHRLDITGGYGRVEPGYSWLTSSDIRYKKNISTLTNSLEKLMKMRGVRFDLIDDENSDKGSGKYIGFIAQELETMFPELVVTETSGYKSVAYDKMTSVLVEAVKEQQMQIESAKEENKLLKSELQSLKEEIENIKTILAEGGN